MKDKHLNAFWMISSVLYQAIFTFADTVSYFICTALILIGERLFPSFALQGRLISDIIPAISWARIPVGNLSTAMG